jgi:UDP-N-acetylmuramate dehydrogenase
MEFRTQGDHVVLEAQAAEPWDDVVAAAVARDLAGIECLSGIPGTAGATPIQNVGAYGQEVADTLRSLRVLDRRSLEVRELPAAECDFSYRNSVFKREPGQAIVLSVCFALRPGARPVLAYRELANALADRARPSLSEVRETVLDLRRKKSMVYDAGDPNRRSAGSFFTNPIVSADQAAAVSAQAVAEKLVQAPEEVPQYPLPNGRVKLAAGWLVERAGVERGLRMGPVGVSSRHALALVHHGGGCYRRSHPPGGSRARHRGGSLWHHARARARVPGRDVAAAAFGVEGRSGDTRAFGVQCTWGRSQP